MATSQKKTTKAKGGARAANTKSGSRTAAKNTSGRNKKPEPRPIRREVCALVFLLLALFSALGYFHVEAIFIDFLCNLEKGLFGYGFWLFPPALLVSAIILLFHHGRPVRLRVWSTMLLPVTVGSFLDMLLVKNPYTLDSAVFKALWQDGKALTCGGVISGLLSQGMVRVFSKIGAGIIFALIILALVMIAGHVTPAQAAEWMRSRPHPEYEEEELPAPKTTPEKRAEPKRPLSLLERRDRRRAAIDIPMDEGEADAESEEEEEPEPVKRGFFNRKPRVPTPDQVLTGSLDQPEEPELFAEPEYEPEPDPEPVEPPKPFRVRTEPIPDSDPEPCEAPAFVPPVTRAAAASSPAASAPAAAVFSNGGSAAGTAPAPSMPPVTREPAVGDKLKKGEAAEAAAQVEEEAAAALAQTGPVYQYPPVSLLDEADVPDSAGVSGELKANQARLTDTIHSFGIDANIVNVTRGPSVTRYELELDQGVRLNKLTNLADDIALSLGASGVRIAPIPNRISMVGIEVPNKLVTPVPIHEVIDSRAFRDHSSKVAFALGKDIGGSCIVGNIAKLPHLLIAGTTGSGKSVCTNSLIISLLYKATPEEVRLIMVDPKMVELGIYNGIPHLLIPVVTDPKKAAGALQWAVTEMMKRYRAFSEIGVRDLASYNSYAAKHEDMKKMPQVVVVIDELADLMLVAAKEVEESICRVAQMGRAAGMHLIIATQRPSADVITGLMKANIPSRIAFAVASSLESRIILDQTGAEKLVGRGDMLYFPLGAGKPTRVQGCLISDEEVARVVGFIKQSGDAQYDESVLQEIDKNVAGNEKGSKGVGGAAPDGVDNDFDEMLPNAIEVVVETGMASVSMLQRRLKLGYSRAARLVDQMEEQGIVGPFEGSKPRQVLISKEQWQEMQYKQGMSDLPPDAPPVSEPVPDELDFEGDAIPQSRDVPPFDIDEEDF